MTVHRGQEIVVEDNDPGTMQFELNSYAVDESAASISIAVTREPSSIGTISVDYTTADDMALAGEDYIATSGTLTFFLLPGATTGESPRRYGMPKRWASPYTCSRATTRLR